MLGAVPKMALCSLKEEEGLSTECASDIEVGLNADEKFLHEIDVVLRPPCDLGFFHENRPSRGEHFPIDGLVGDGVFAGCCRRGCFHGDIGSYLFQS